MKSEITINFTPEKIRKKTSKAEKISLFKHTPKTQAMIEAAEKMNGDNLSCQWLPLNLAVSFRSNPVASPDEDNSRNPPIVGAPITEKFPNIHTVPTS